MPLDHFSKTNTPATKLVVLTLVTSGVNLCPGVRTLTDSGKINGPLTLTELLNTILLN